MASSTSRNINTKYRLEFYVPHENLQDCLKACFSAGAGSYPGGLYSECGFVFTGKGQFRCSEDSTPHVGKPGEVEHVEESKVELLCLGEECMRKAVKWLKEAHPYEQVAFAVFKMEDLGDGL